MPLGRTVREGLLEEVTYTLRSDQQEWITQSLGSRVAWLAESGCWASEHLFTLHRKGDWSFRLWRVFIVVFFRRQWVPSDRTDNNLPKTGAILFNFLRISASFLHQRVHGVWYATVHGVAKHQTRLSDFTLTFTLYINNHSSECGKHEFLKNHLHKSVLNSLAMTSSQAYKF